MVFYRKALKIFKNIINDILKNLWLGV